MRAKSIVLIIFVFLVSYSSAKTLKVLNIGEFNQQVKTLIAGDTIVLANGVWNDVELKFKAKGQKEKPIFLTAETFGKVTLEGKSCLQFSGEYLHISGLIFRNGYGPKSTVIEFKTSSTDYAYNSTITNCVIDKYSQPIKDSADHWVGVWGKKNIVEYCYFGGKSNEGTTLVVWPDDSNSTNNGHLISRNYFGPRPRLGSNGGETIRIGTSQVCHLSSGTIVDGNYFEHCNGETEIISNKSCDNIFVNNTFFESEGSLVLRHGNNATVSGNWFIGNGKINTGGVRVINEGHKIFNNFFYKLAGDEFRSGLAIMNTIPDSPANGYAPVKNVIFANNTYYDCAFPLAFGVGLGERNRIVKPESTLLLNNLVYCPNTAELIKYYDTSEGIKLYNNILVNAKGTSKDKGAVEVEVLKDKVFGIDMVYSTLKAKKLPFVKYDILGQVRGETVVGAFQNEGEKPKIELATSMNCGPEWYKPIAEIQKPKAISKTIFVEVGTDQLTKAIAKASPGDVLILAAGEHIISNKIVLNKDITFKAAQGAKPDIRLQSEKKENSFFELGSNSVVRFDGIILNGDSKAKFPAKYVFVSAKEGAYGYSLHLNNCEISNMNVDSGAIFKASKGSYSDTISIRNSVLRNSFRGISLSEENDNTGKYNVENLIIDNTVFNAITQSAIDYYRGGNDESTLGGVLSINHCVFEAVGNDEKQTIIKLTGIVSVSISNSIFSNSLAKSSVKLSGAKNKISNCNFSNCATATVEKGASSANLSTVN
jgi:poly(beta-D-mannuronate) lyase